MATTLMSITPPRCGPMLDNNMTRKILPKENNEETFHKYDQQIHKQTQRVPTSPDNRESGRLHRKKSKCERALVGRYKLIKTIGTGNFAKVKLAEHLITGKEVAIKIIDKTDLSSSSRRKLSREVRLMKVLKHPNIVRLLEIIDTEKMMYLVMEYAKGGELYEYLFDNGRMTEKAAREKFRQILSAVQYCHQKRIVHRDLKTENLLLDSELNIKLADFGFANEFQEGTKLNTFCGSPPYAAPELFKGKEYDGPEVDVWSLGVILFKLVSGALPFDGSSLSELRDRVLRGRYRIPFYMSTECEKLLKKMLVLNPAKRYSVEAIMKDPWVNLGYADDPLLPYVEPKPDCTDPARISTMMNMGFSLDAILSSLKNSNFDEVTATYYLLENKESRSSTEEIPKQSDDVHIITCSSGAEELPESQNGEQNTTDMDNHANPCPTVQKVMGNIIIENQTPAANKLDKDSDMTSKESSFPEVRTDLQNEEKIIVIQMPSDKIVTVLDNQKPDDSNEAENLNARSIAKVELPPASKRNSAIHWYPTAGIAIQNGKLSVGENKGGQNPREKNTPCKTSQIDQNKDFRVDRVVQRSAANEEQRNPRVSIQVRTDENNTVKTLDPLELQEKSRQPFGRHDPIRQTVHCTNRPRLEQQLNDKYFTPGMGENKATAVAAARTNLNKLECENADRYEVPLKDSNKSKGFFRSLTSRFSKRSRPLLDKSDVGHDREEDLPYIHAQFDEHRQESPDVVLNTSIKSGSVRLRTKQPVRPHSQIASGSKRISRELELTRTFSPFVNDSVAPSGRGETESHENSAVGFFRSLALRFSKRKPSYSSNLTDPVDVRRSAEDESSTMRPQENVSIIPPSLPTSMVDRARTFEEGKIVKISDSHYSELDGRPSSYLVSNSETQEKPRVVRFKWNMKITSKMSPEEIVKEIIRVLRDNNFSYEQQTKFTFLCETHNGDVHDYVAWEMEVCESPRMGVNGVRIHKVTGTTSEFKSIMNKITQQMKL